MAVALAIYSWYFDVRAEILDSGTIARITILWSVVPVLVGLIYIASVLLTKDHTVNFGNAARVLIIYNLVGFYYAANGISDPNTAGHLHVFIVPIFLGAPMSIAVVAMMITMIRACIKGSAAPPSLKDDQGADCNA